RSARGLRAVESAARQPARSLRPRHALHDLGGPGQLLLFRAVADFDEPFDGVAFDGTGELVACCAIAGLREERETQLIGFDFRRQQRDRLAAAFGAAFQLLEFLRELELETAGMRGRIDLRLPPPADFGRHYP